MAETERRRRRLRHPATPDRDQTATAGRDQTAAPGRDQTATAAATAGVTDTTTMAPTRRTGPEERDTGGDRGLRGLVGSGNSQVTVTAALRARDASRPSDQDLAEAEARLVMVRRNWVPREELPRPGR